MAFGAFVLSADRGRLAHVSRSPASAAARSRLVGPGRGAGWRSIFVGLVAAALPPCAGRRPRLDPPTAPPTPCWPSSCCRALAGGLRAPLRRGRRCWPSLLATPTASTRRVPPVVRAGPARRRPADVAKDFGRRARSARWLYRRASCAVAARSAARRMRRGSCASRSFPGDGIGVEVIAEAVKVLEAVAGAVGPAIRTDAASTGAPTTT